MFMNAHLLVAVILMEGGTEKDLKVLDQEEDVVGSQWVHVIHHHHHYHHSYQPATVNFYYRYLDQQHFLQIK